MKKVNHFIDLKTFYYIPYDTEHFFIFFLRLVLLSRKGKENFQTTTVIAVGFTTTSDVTNGEHWKTICFTSHLILWIFFHFYFIWCAHIIIIIIINMKNAIDDRRIKYFSFLFYDSNKFINFIREALIWPHRTIHHTISSRPQTFHKTNNI